MLKTDGITAPYRSAMNFSKIKIFLLSVVISISTAFMNNSNADEIMPYAIDKIDKNGNYIARKGTFNIDIGDEIETYNEYPLFLSRRKLSSGSNGAIAVSFNKLNGYLMKATGMVIYINSSETSKLNFFVYSCRGNKIIPFDLRDAQKVFSDKKGYLTNIEYNSIFKNKFDGFHEISYPFGDNGVHEHMIEIHNSGKEDEVIIGAFYFDAFETAARSVGKTILEGVFGDKYKKIKNLYDKIQSKIDDSEFRKITEKANKNFNKVCKNKEGSAVSNLFCDSVNDYFISYEIAKISAPYMCYKR